MSGIVGNSAPTAGEGRRLRSIAAWSLALGVLLVVSALVAVGIGPVSIVPGKVAGILAQHLGWSGAAGDWNLAESNIVWQLRLPRVLLGAIAGAGLAVVGAVLQVLTRNPLADPYLFGVSAGAALGAVIVILHIGPFAGMLGLPLAAFIGAMAAMLLVFLAAHGGGQTPSSGRLVLTGVAVAFILQAVTNTLIVSDSHRAADTVLFWMMGGLATARWDSLLAPALATLLGTLWLCLRAPAINALAFGDDTAQSLGIHVGRLRIEVLVVAALITGTIVAACGGIGFVGLMLPHVTRFFTGGNLKRLLPVTALLGAIFLVWVDAAARTVFAPREIPLGVVTSLIGGLFFLWLMRKKKV
ncbi:iron ABC transporter permease [Methyloligella sp. 2.7D]|uniref:FecCD family ABC transporter permease n=1 Tax=unclassified Methyloligella TaxID=2625955 RepID=UPI00157E00BC|nr:iron ABC transporter permease [Methyloligella sp. GL2]QKP78230.1 iron ABC transporter permease [Methyloligella sp. GL2]